MLQVAHPPNIGPKCPPPGPSSSPVLRQQIVHMVKSTRSQRLRAQLHTSESTKRPLLDVTNQEHKSILKNGFGDVNKTPSASGLRRTGSGHQKGPLEKQTRIIPIRRILSRPQQQGKILKPQDSLTKEKENLTTSQSSSENRDSSAKSCEIKGSAIKASELTSAQKKQDEIQQKTKKFSASLHEFKRRLMMNQSKFYPQSGHPDQYKLSMTNAGQSSSVQTHVSPTNKLIRGSFYRESTDVARPKEQEVEIPPKPTYRLPLRDVTNTIHPVDTYVVVQNQRERLRGKFDEPLSLTMHNLSMHNMFIEMDERKKRDGRTAAVVRIHKWLNDVNAAGIKPSRTVRFNLTSSDSSSSDTDSGSEIFC